jgi:DNA-binding MarR family transcriptional regulator
MVFGHPWGSAEEKMTERKQQETESERDSNGQRSAGLALRHPLRVSILAACHRRELTPKEFAEERGMHVSKVGYHFRALQKEGYIQVVREERARGSKRYFYRAKRAGSIGDEEFAQSGPEGRREVSEGILRDFVLRCVEAMEAETFDARPDSHLTWTPLELDQQAWSDLMAELSRAFKVAYEIQAEAQARLRKSGESPIPVTFGLAGFESPASRET